MLGLTALGLAAIPLAALALGSPAQETIPKLTLVAGGLFLGWVAGYLGESIAWVLWPLGV